MDNTVRAGSSWTFSSREIEINLQSVLCTFVQWFVHSVHLHSVGDSVLYTCTVLVTVLWTLVQCWWQCFVHSYSVGDSIAMIRGLGRHGRLTLLGRERKEEKGRRRFHHGGRRWHCTIPCHTVPISNPPWTDLCHNLCDTYHLLLNAAKYFRLNQTSPV